MEERIVFENTLLGFLCEGPAHGYELSLHFAEGGDLAAVGQLGRSQVYALLKALEAQGLTVASLREGAGGPARRVLTVTGPGRVRFLEWVSLPSPSIRGLRVEFPLKVYFFRRLELEGLGELFADQRAVLEERLAEVEARRSRAGEVTRGVLALQARLLRAGLDWLDDGEGAWARRAGAGPREEVR